MSIVVDELCALVESGIDGTDATPEERADYMREVARLLTVNANALHIPADAPRSERESSYHPGRTCQDVADRLAASFVERARRRSLCEDDVYAEESGKVRSYMLGGGGPTEYATVIRDSDGEVDYIVIEYREMSGEAFAVVDGRDAEILAERLDAPHDPSAPED